MVVLVCRVRNNQKPHYHDTKIMQKLQATKEKSPDTLQENHNGRETAHMRIYQHFTSPSTDSTRIVWNAHPVSLRSQRL